MVLVMGILVERGEGRRFCVFGWMLELKVGRVGWLYVLKDEKNYRNHCL